MRRILVGLALVLASIGVAAETTRRGAARRAGGGAPPEEAVTPDTPASHPRDVGQVRVRFQPRAPIASYAGRDRVALYQVGVVEEGAEQYVGGSLLLLRVEGGPGPCKGPGCSGPFYARLIQSEDRLVHLPRLSPNGSWLAMVLAGEVIRGMLADDSAGNQALLDFLGGFGRLEIDRETVVPEVAFHGTFAFGGLEFRLAAYGGDADGAPDSAILRPAFKHQELGWIHTTRPEVAPQGFFYNHERPYETTDPEGEGVSGCRDEECYHSNAFFWFRPDGTYLQYVYQPPFGVDDVRVTDTHQLAREYFYWTRSGCSDGQADYASVVSPAVLGDGRLRPIGSVAGSDDSILGLIEPDDAYARSFYDRYLNARDDWWYGEKPQPVTFAEFTRELPFFFWKDPFDRLIRFTNAAYLPPFTCEPVVYLYPETERSVEVRLGDRVRVLRAAPEYGGSWRVRASPDGSLLALGERHSFLFWEGIAGIMPRPEQGFVVPRADIETFFRRTLARLGLTDLETEDFLTAWLPAFGEAAYYRIGFYDRATIDAYAPLEVTPRPTTVIRVLFDYQPLSAPMQLEEPVLPPRVPREGFTVVEWGGLKR